MSHRTKRSVGVGATLVACASFAIWLTPLSARQARTTVVSAAANAGATTTRLADGRWLVVGGEGAEARAWVWDPLTEIATAPATSLQVPRAWHTATMLADGTVLLAGGRNARGLAELPEIFDPATNTFALWPIAGTVGRASHTATLLTDGRVLVAGGARGGPGALETEIWDLRARTATPVPGSAIARSGHTATLMPDGRVLVAGGMALDGSAAGDAVLLDPVGGPQMQVPPKAERSPTTVTASIPEAGARDVALDAHLTLRLSAALNVASLSAETLKLAGPRGGVATRLVAAEDGRLVFVWPVEPLNENTTYVLTVSGLVDRNGAPVVPAWVPFTTKRDTEPAGHADAEDWIPDPAGGWRTNRPESPWRTLKPLEAPPGVTALSGQVLRLNGEPLADVRLEIEHHAAHTDRTGRFLVRLDGMGTSHIELWIDGHPASRPGATYGTYEVGVNIQGGRTNVLPYTIWMTKLDTAHAVTIPSPTVADMRVTTPLIPGLELRIPAGAVIRDHDGKPITTLGMTPVPLDRPPFPLPADVRVPVYFTIQPGGAYVYVSGTPARRGARLIYPNGFHLPPATVFDFWQYNPDGAGWWVYGHGQVTPDGQQVVPNPGVEIYEFTGAMAGPPGLGPSNGPPPGGNNKDGDPVDLYTGLFVLQKTDLTVADVAPVALTRTYRPADARSRAFGIGATHPYDQFLVGDTFPYTYLDLVLADGGRVHYDRTSEGTGYQDAVYQHVQTPTDWFQSTITWNGTGWTLTKPDGTVLTFRDGFNATRPQQAALTGIQDRYGNLITLTRDPDANLTQIRTPNGRFITLTYDPSYRITQAQDNIGRTVGYTYDTSGRLWKVTDPENGVTEYAYDGAHRVTRIKDPRGIIYLMNQYDGQDRVTRQVLADGGAYQFAYSVDGQGNAVTEGTNPRGYVTRTTFNAAGYAIARVEAVGTTVERTTTTTREAGTNFVTSVLDGLNRRTDYTYDGHGHVATVTRLAGTADAVTTHATYEPRFFQMATLTDPLQHVWTWTYDGQGRLTGLTDPVSHHTTVVLNAAGQVASVTDPLSHQWQFTYTDGDLTATTNPLTFTTTRFIDGAGRAVATTDPLGRMTRTTFDGLNRATQVIDPLNGPTAFSYDPNSNLQALTDARTHTTSYTYDLMDRVATRRDPLPATATYEYDPNNNLTQRTDRKGQITRYAYDPLDRLAQVTFADASTITYTYDAGDRLLQLVDSANGTITRTYDGLDRLTSETTAEGTITYTYDDDNRRATMTVAGQSPVSYGYDDAHRLLSITQGPSVVAFTYDDANRRSTLTYPNGIVATYGYDDANQLTSLTYTLGPTALGDLTYTYDAAGQRTSVGGSWARTGLPTAVASATYDAANRIVTWDGSGFSYDPNGNLASDGLTSYSWNARNQLSALSGGTSASFAYDSLGRRRSKSIGGATTNFLHDARNIVQELTSGGTPAANLLTGRGIDETFTRTDGSGTSTLLTDVLDSVLEIADASGTLQTHYTFEPFGTTTTSGAASTNAQAFTGRENDGTGLYFYRARYYSPQLQRFVSEDPLGLLADINVYRYVGDAPTQLTDPLGLQALNRSPVPVWGKPEHGEKPVCIPPGGYYPDPLDGISVPSTNPDSVYKIPDHTGVIIEPVGNQGWPVTVFPPPTAGGEAPVTIFIPPVPGIPGTTFPGYGWVPWPRMLRDHPDWQPLHDAPPPTPPGGRKDPPKCPGQ
jgi:RHS repeat-associated protein